MRYRILITGLLAAFLSGCGGHGEAEHHDEADEVKVYYTSYTDRLELFAEADPLAAGRSSVILSHFTELDNFKPIEADNVTLKLSVDGAISDQLPGKPGNKGIYTFEVTPVKSGTGSLQYTCVHGSDTMTVTVEGIKVFNTGEEADSSARAEALPATNTFTFTKEQSWKVDFETARPSVQKFGAVIRTAAIVKPAPGDEVILTAGVNGVIAFPDYRIVEGAGTSTGQKLLTVSTGGYAYGNLSVAYAEAKSNYERALADYERVKKLEPDKIVSVKEVQQVTNEYEKSRSVYENLKRNYTESGQVITAPVNGFIKSVKVRNGQFVEAGDPLLVIAQNKTLIIHSEIQQRYAAGLRSVSDANIKVPGDDRTYTLKELDGRIISGLMAPSDDSYLIPFNIIISDNGILRPGTTVDLFLKSSDKDSSMTVPANSLLEEQGIYYLFVQVTPEMFEKREVKTGGTDGLNTEILSGIMPTDRIVTKGAVLIKLARATGSLDAHSGHVH